MAAPATGPDFSTPGAITPKRSPDAVRSTPCPSWPRRLLLFRTLTLLWIFPSVGGFWILGRGLDQSRRAGGWFEGLAAVRFEEWVAMLLICLHLVFVIAWRWSRRRAMG